MFFKINKKQLLSVLKDFPETFEAMVNVAESRQRRLGHYIDPTNNPLAKEDEIDPEDCKTELFGADAEQIVTAKEEETHKSRLKQHRHTHRLAAIQQRGPPGKLPTKNEAAGKGKVAQKVIAPLRMKSRKFMT